MSRSCSCRRALTTDELVPLAKTSALEGGDRKIVYHRRGYGRSTAVRGPGSIARDAADCRSLMDALGIDRAHHRCLVQCSGRPATRCTGVHRRRLCPVLYLGGTDSGAWFAEVRELMLEWFPGADEVVIEGADHWLALTHLPEISDAVAAFVRDHPMDHDLT